MAWRQSSITEWGGIFAAIWLLMAPFILGYSNVAARTNDIWLGIIIGGAALARSFMDEQRMWLDGILLLAGIWLVLAPYVLGYTNSSASINDILLGLVVLVLSVWDLRIPAGSQRRHVHV